MYKLLIFIMIIMRTKDFTAWSSTGGSEVAWTQERNYMYRYVCMYIYMYIYIYIYVFTCIYVCV